MGDILAPRKPRDIANSTVGRKEGEARPHPINLAKLESLILVLEIARVRADKRTTTPIMAEKYGAVWKTQLGRRNCKDHKEDAPQNTLNGTSFAEWRPRSFSGEHKNRSGNYLAPRRTEDERMERSRATFDSQKTITDNRVSLESGEIFETHRSDFDAAMAEEERIRRLKGKATATGPPSPTHKTPRPLIRANQGIILTSPVKPTDAPQVQRYDQPLLEQDDAILELEEGLDQALDVPLTELESTEVDNLVLETERLEMAEKMMAENNIDENMIDLDNDDLLGDELLGETPGLVDAEKIEVISQLSPANAVSKKAASTNKQMERADWIRRLDGKAEEVSKTFDDFLEKVVQEHDLDVDKKRSGFVDTLLSIQREQTAPFVFDRSNIKLIILDMFIGGTTTTSSLLEWTLTELVRHPECVKKLRDEICSVSAHNSYVNEEDVEKMNYLNAIIKETLRLHPPLSIIVPRLLSEDVRLRGYDIAAGTQVMINAWAIQRDNATWGPDAEEFKPERHLNSSLDFQGQDYKFIPFGSGRRLCPAIRLALVLVEVTVANFAKRFDWRVQVGPHGVDKLDLAEAAGIEACRKYPLIVFPTSVVFRVKWCHVPSVGVVRSALF
ncbi:hypothetical protein Bca4012_080027 [Brassica carinata]